MLDIKLLEEYVDKVYKKYILKKDDFQYCNVDIPLNILLVDIYNSGADQENECRAWLINKIAVYNFVLSYIANLNYMHQKLYISEDYFNKRIKVANSILKTMELKN